MTALFTCLFFSCGEGGGETSSGASSSVATQQASALGSLSFQVNTGLIPRILAQTTGSPDTILVDILDPQTRETVHPQSQFAFSRNVTSQTFTVSQVVPGTHLVRIQIFDSNGNLFFTDEEQATLAPAQATSVVFTFGGGGTGNPSPAFLVADNADDEQGQPDVDVTDDGYFFIAARVTDASAENNGSDFDTYGFIHAERFTTTFDGSLPTSLDDANGNNGDFDVSQFSTLQDAVEMTDAFFAQQAVHPRVALNQTRTAVITWLDSNPSPSAGGITNTIRQPIIRTVILGPTSNTTNNSSGFREPEFFTPVNAEPNVAGPSNLLTRPSVSITEENGGLALIDYAFFDGGAVSQRYSDGGVSANGVPPNGAPPLFEANNNVTAAFQGGVNLSVANRPSGGGVVVVGRDTSFSNRVAAELTFPPSPAPGFAIINEGQPSEDDVNDTVEGVEVDWYAGGEIAVVYSIFDVSTGGAGLYARCFSADLNAAVGPEIEIAPPTAGVDHIFPDISVAENDDTFLVTWTRIQGLDSEVFLQRFRCSDGARGPLLAVSQGEALAIPNRNRFSRVAATSSGDAVVAWQTGQPIDDTPNVRALARIFPASTTTLPNNPGAGF